MNKESLSHPPEHFYRLVARLRARRQRRGLWVALGVLAYFLLRALAS